VASAHGVSGDKSSDKAVLHMKILHESINNSAFDKVFVVPR
jgi:hypothetical protein